MDWREMSLASRIRKIKILKMIARIYRKTKNALKSFVFCNRNIKNYDEKIVYYFGAARHPNLGDLAQSVCIRKWISKHYSEYRLIEVETNIVVYTYYSALNRIRKHIKKDDLIVFQSGYTTTDLGGYADEMHRKVIKSFPKNKMLMLPQTIYFQYKENEKRTSKEYDLAENMLFLARDNKSFEKAKLMFQNIKIEIFPDIVTSLIGKYSFSEERDNILLCCRNDSEKYYSDSEIEELKKTLSNYNYVDVIDTTKKKRDVVKRAEEYIENEIISYSKYKVIITDRFHGTIFALAANTPIIVLKTKDHKVTEGAKWFLDVYKDYIFVADSLEQAEIYANEILSKKYSYKLESYFENKYYDKLPQIWK
jgi:exopolysaccharide biosynthesis predicted pyruvyltransferase EpsI